MIDENFKNKFYELMTGLFDALPEPDENYSIEAHFEYWHIKCNQIMEKTGRQHAENTLDATIMDKLTPLMKQFVSDANEILKKEEK